VLLQLILEYQQLRFDVNPRRIGKPNNTQQLNDKKVNDSELTEYSTMPTIGEIVVKGYDATLGSALDKARNIDDFPA
jgi:hypothetical protein